MEGATIAGTATPPGHIDNLQILRFIAAFAVLLSHAASLALPSTIVFWRFPWTAGVDIFFIISGMIMTIVTDGQFGRAVAAREFLVRRAIRIVPTYWLFTAGMIAVMMAMPDRFRSSAFDPATIASSFLFFPYARADGDIVPILSQGWTLNYEAFFYLAFGAALLHRRGLILLVACFLLLVALHPLIPRQAVAATFWTDPIILEFVAGIGLGWLWLGGLRVPPLARLLLALAAVLLFAVGERYLFGGTTRALANGFPALLLCASLVLGTEPRSPGVIRSVLIRAGDASYALYLSHTFSIGAVALLLGNAIEGVGGLTMMVAVAIAVAVAIHLWVERPMLRTLRRRLDRQRARKY